MAALTSKFARLAGCRDFPAEPGSLCGIDAHCYTGQPLSEGIPVGIPAPVENIVSRYCFDGSPVLRTVLSFTSPIHENTPGPLPLGSGMICRL